MKNKEKSKKEKSKKESKALKKTLKNNLKEVKAEKKRAIKEVKKEKDKAVKAIKNLSKDAKKNSAVGAKLPVVKDEKNKKIKKENGEKDEKVIKKSSKDKLEKNIEKSSEATGTTYRSVDLKADEAISRVTALGAAKDVDDFVTKEKRSTILKAAERRKSELNEVS